MKRLLGQLSEALVRLFRAAGRQPATGPSGAFPWVETALGGGAALLIYLALAGVNVLPVVVLVGLVLLLSQSGLLRSMEGRRPAVMGKATVPGVKFDEIGGQAGAKKELLEAIEFVADHERVARMGIRPLKGILLTGPPGTGKTLLAKAAAHHTDSVFLSAAGSDFVEMYAGVGAQRVREIFRKAREAARAGKKRSAVIFIDEMDVLGARRGSHSTHMEYDQTLNALLVEMDGLVVDAEVQVLVMAATNRVDMLDPALMRPGRFDRIVSVDLPDKEGRLAILQLHTRSKPLGPDVDLEGVARQTFGFSGAHLESLANEAAILALREGSEWVSMAHLTEAVDKVILGERLDRAPSDAEKHRVAVHEAGHALVGEWVEPGSVSTVTVTPRGRAMGYVRTNPTEDRYLYTRPMLEGQIRVALAGFLAEEMICGEGSTGAGADFARVAELARQIVDSGMSDLGIVDPRGVSDGARSEVTRALVGAQQEAVRGFLQRHRETLEAVIQVLVAEEVVSGSRLRGLLACAPPADAEQAAD